MYTVYVGHFAAAIAKIKKEKTNYEIVSKLYNSALKMPTAHTFNMEISNVLAVFFFRFNYWKRHCFSPLSICVKRTQSAIVSLWQDSAGTFLHVRSAHVDRGKSAHCSFRICWHLTFSRLFPILPCRFPFRFHWHLLACHFDMCIVIQRKGKEKYSEPLVRFWIICTEQFQWNVCFLNCLNTQAHAIWHIHWPVDVQYSYALLWAHVHDWCPSTSAGRLTDTVLSEMPMQCKHHE